MRGPTRLPARPGEPTPPLTHAHHRSRQLRKAAARGIVWDLLQEGVAISPDFKAAVDSRRCAQGRLGLDAGWLADQLEGYEDQEPVDHPRGGVNFKTDLAYQTVLHPHLASIAPFVARFNSELERLASFGYQTRYASLPFTPCRATGSGSVPKAFDEPPAHLRLRRPTKGDSRHR